MVKRMIVNALLCALLVACALVAYENHLDILAGVFFILAVIPSCLFEQARKEHRGV